MQYDSKLTAGVLLAMLKSPKRHNTSMYFHTHRAPGAERWQRDTHVCTISVKHRPYDDTKVERVVTAETYARVANGAGTVTRVVKSSDGFPSYTEYDTSAEWYEPETGFWSLFASEDEIRNILSLLPKDAVITFEVILDGGTNGYAARSGLHIDLCYMLATWKKRGKEQRMKFLVDQTTCEHNTARFGGAKSDYMHVGAALRDARNAMNS